jgi:hypothetical protein
VLARTKSRYPPEDALIGIAFTVREAYQTNHDLGAVYKVVERPGGFVGTAARIGSPYNIFAKTELMLYLC